MELRSKESGMGLTRYKLGDLIELEDVRNEHGEYTADDVRGVNNLKELIKTKANLSGRDLSKFQIVEPGVFFFNHRTSRNGSRISVTYNYEGDDIIVTEDYVLFRVRNEQVLSPIWLYLYFCRTEFDRYAIANSWGSSTEFFNWEDMCDVEIDLPPIEIQQRYVDIYNAMVANQKCYEDGLEDLKLACDAELEHLMMQEEHRRIGEFIELLDERNQDETLGQQAVRGITTEKQFIPTKAKLDGVNLKSYKIVYPGNLAYVADTSRRGDKISIAYNNDAARYLVSSITTVFGCREDLLPAYLMLFFTRPEFDRYARFHSWGSAREVFSWEDMQEVRIPIPDIEIQESLADLFTAYNQRREINERMKAQMKDICPILIKGSLEEASKS